MRNDILDQNSIDEKFSVSLKYGKKNQGLTKDNPCVGAALFKNAHFINGACTAKNGRPHAEQILRNLVPETWEKYDLFLTLEPCNFLGKSEVCCDIILEKKPKSITIGIKDPHPKTNGNSFIKLQKAGLKIYRPSMQYQRESAKQMLGFIMRQKYNRPAVTLKAASSLDGKIALADGSSQWITKKTTRKHAHFRRSFYDAILSTAKNVLFDQAKLTCRVPGLQDKTITRVILDAQNILHKNCPVFQDIATNPVIIICSSKKELEHIQYPLAKKYICPLYHGRFRLLDVLHVIAQEKVNHVLVEAGPSLLHQFIDENIFEYFEHYTAPSFLGHDSLGFTKDFHIKSLDNIKNCHIISHHAFINNDVFTLYENTNVSDYIDSFIN